ncbi:hydrogenase nickel incorporation protein HypA [bacterium (Candidatus Blackallbacteria) CG17_big_fil_post_rev_8_21_14_2_50_48_46]|uniref:Hydrogenase nickel incorporation protein HypA n=1 Tax=bacterium (Candidatus Blackallbacteria) CG17_big_fil_post_rev_8_21_14_2_50_48_46 TaxID=2014261 RepID=A0A2M7FZW9_9BACT|nr:MAG: hydrogenase nickel incorporation protein HypA [bacterium (Candidatus Blackallbacteria) CG18_big_fil_WC_8_21_14_2_50_49_26]PIW14479.1 MAG: hydrogenase nickel incorporation protein HypA [bacterium (Candidatus Blackallbacteria) CG17_big_fil_post_rev_8_21_14_2_50_48_46]PIW47165.1 MAG: hydrogenase nickel incorporation protein HypA [bacterium (Candidatus Blackallbacteria) CG13_big_fil_rev_8_21_14_2_50_49_14]
MHEFSLLADLLRKIETVRQEEQAEKIVSLTVKLGALSHISACHFREHFEHAIQGTPLAGAELEIEVATDEMAPDAQDIRLLSVEVE